MKIISRGRGQGKTTELIILAANKGATIVCIDEKMREWTKRMAHDMKIKINEPITHYEFKSGRYMEKYRGTAKISELLFDDADVFLQSLAPTKISTVAINDRYV